MTDSRAPGRWWALAGLLAADAATLLDTTIVQVAGPTIAADLGGGPRAVTWFGAAYTLPFAVLLVPGGRLGDVAGRRRVFRTGVVAFLLASVGCALAPSVGVLVALRVLQGAAAALVVPQTIGLIKAMFAGAEVSRALGANGPVMSAAAICGPLIGGLLTAADLLGSSWRATFLVNVPVCVAVLVLAVLLPEDRASERVRLDALGISLLAGGTGLLVWPLVAGGGPLLAVAGLVVLALFAVHQRRASAPLVARTLFRGPAFPMALACTGLLFMVTTGLAFVVALHLQFGIGLDPGAAALGLLPLSAGTGLASWIAGAHLVQRYGVRLLPAGLVLLGAGLLAAALGLGPRTVALALAGSGAGLFVPALFTTTLHSLAPQEIGSAAGLLNACQQLGSTLGVAGLGAVYLAAGFGAACGVALAGVVVTAVTSALLRLRLVCAAGLEC
jgi:MFS family permease